MHHSCPTDPDEPDAPARTAVQELTGRVAGHEAAPRAPRHVLVPRTGSTNDDLRSALTGVDGLLDLRAARAWPHLSSLRAVEQTAGRGRGAHVWTTPPRGALTISFVLRPVVPLDRLAWLPLLAGLAIHDALTEDACLAQRGWRVATKWPNDVVLLPAPESTCAGLDQVPGWGRARKVAGVLTELVLPAEALGKADDAWRPQKRDQAPAVVLGIGLNVGQRPEQLPVDWAISLAAAGWQVEVEEVAQRLAAHLARLVDQWEADDGDPDRQGRHAGLGGRLREVCWSLGRRVRVRTPAGVVRGEVIDLRAGLVLRGAQGEVLVQAGDVEEAREGE